MSYELFSKDPNEIQEGVHGLVKALVQGTYSEQVNDSGPKVKIVAEWREGENVVRPHLNVLGLRRPKPPQWREVRYASYD